MFNTLSAVVNGALDAVKLFEKGGKYELTDSKLKNALKTLLNFGRLVNTEQKEALSALLADVANRGSLAVLDGKESVKAIVAESMNEINGKLVHPLNQRQLNDASDAFADLFEQIATNRISDEISKQFAEPKKRTPVKDKNPSVARLLLYTDIENDADLRNAFAQKYGLPSISNQQAARLRSLAIAVAQAPSGFLKNTAIANLNNYINSLKGGASIKSKVNDLLNYMVNNILTAFDTFATTVASNVLQVSEVLASSLITGDWGWGKQLGARIPGVDITYPDGSGTKTVRLDINPYRLNMLSALRGNPKITHLLKGDLPESEQRIREAKTRLERNLRRAFTVSASRMLTFTDGMVSAIPENITRYQLYKAFVKDWYKKRGIPFTGRDVQRVVEQISAPTSDMVESAALQAMNEIRGGLLWTQLGYGNNADFPLPSSIKGFKSLTSNDAKIYIEYIARVMEILSEEQEQLVRDVLQSASFPVDSELNEKLKEITNVVASVTNEVSFFGRPRGSAGELYDALSSIGDKVTFLKFGGAYPLFIGALSNTVAKIIRQTPGVNLVQAALYSATGTRGSIGRLLSGKGLKGNKEYQFAPTVRYDQKKLWKSAIAWTVTSAAAAAYFRDMYGDDEEKFKSDINNGKVTCITPINFTASQRRAFTSDKGDILKEGYVYINGKPTLPYNKTPWLGFFAAVEYLSNYDKFERSSDSRNVYVEQDPEMSALIGGYLFNFYLTTMNQSSLGELGKVFNDITSIRAKDSGIGMVEKAEQYAAQISANFAKNMVPYGRQLGQFKNVYDAWMQNPKKVGRSFFEKFSLGSMWEDAVVKSNMTDPFGRPVEERLKVVSPAVGLVFFDIRNGEFKTMLDEAYKGDKYMTMHLSHNYSPKISNSKIIPTNVDLDEDGGVALSDLQVLEKQVKSMDNVQGTSVKLTISELAGTSLSYNYELEFAEVQLLNERTGQIVKKIIDSEDNFEAFNSFNDNDYRVIMDKVYSFAQKIALMEQHPDKLSGMAFIKTIENAGYNLYKSSNQKIIYPYEIQDIVERLKENVHE